MKNEWEEAEGSRHGKTGGGRYGGGKRRIAMYSRRGGIKGEDAEGSRQGEAGVRSYKERGASPNRKCGELILKAG